MGRTELSITTVIQRLTCPEFAPGLADPAPTPAMPPRHQGDVLHAMMESYLRDELATATFNHLGVLPADPALRTHMMHRTCNLISFANLLTAGATSVETEAPVDFHIALADRDVHLHGRCDCLVVRGARLLAVDWKSISRTDRLDELQLMFYLYAALVSRDLERGDWLLYYYDRGGTRRGSVTRKWLAAALQQAVEKALDSNSLRPGAHCASCQQRRECTASAYATLG